MAKEYKFYLDGVEVIDPLGWDKSEKKTIRLDKYRGIFIEYINKITFIGDGYDHIKNLADTSGFCGEVNVSIYNLVNQNYVVYFQGIIKLSGVIINESKCEIECNIEDANLSSLINNLGSIKVRFNQTKTLSGESLSTVGYTCNAHNATNITTSVIHDQARTMYKVFDAFQYILNYISDNRITFASTLFSTEVSALIPPTYNGAILFTNPGVDLIGAGNVVINYTNTFNEINTITVPKQATVSSTLNYIISQLNFNAVGSKQQKYYAQDYKYMPRVVTNGTNTITITCYTPGFAINYITGASASIASPGSGSLSDEFGSISICNGNELRGVDIMKGTLFSLFESATIGRVMEISFDDLWDNMNKAFNLGMSLGYVSGVLTLRVERFSYFLGSNQSISLTNIDNLIVKSSEGYTFNSVSVGDGSENIENTGTQNTQDKWIGSSTCYENELDIKNNWIIDSAQINEQLRLRPTSMDTATRDGIVYPDIYEGRAIYNTDTNEINIAIDNVGGSGSWVVADYYYLNSLDSQDDNIFIVECFDALSDGTVRTSYFEHRIYGDTAAAYEQYWAYNANIINYNKIFSWIYLITGDVRLIGYVLTNNSANPIIKEFSFEAPLSVTDDNTILSDVTKFIRINTTSDSTTGCVGWISEIARNNKSGKANFKLIGNK